MADPVYQVSGTLSASSGTSVSSISTTITNVAVGDLLVVQVQRESQDTLTSVASASPALTFARVLRMTASGTFAHDVYVAIATTAAASMTITATYPGSNIYASIVSHRWGSGVTSATPTHTSGHTGLQTSTTNRAAPNVTTTARTLLLAGGTNWNYQRTHTSATNWTTILNPSSAGTEMFLHARIADAGTYPSGNFATANASDQYVAGIAAFAVDTGSAAATSLPPSVFNYANLLIR